MNFVILIWIKEPFFIDQATRNFYFISYLLTFYCSIYYGLSFLILSFIKNNFSKLILIPILFVVIEILREHLGYGFPWITFASIGSGNSYILNLIYYFGTYGLSYFTLVILFLPVVIILFYKKDIKRILLKIYLSVLLSIVLFCIIFIYFRLENENNLEKKLIDVSLAQLNFSLIDKINNNKSNIRHKQIMEIINQNNSDLLVFAENDYPYLVSNLKEFDSITNGLNKNQSIVIGGIKKENFKFYNTLFFIEKNEIQDFEKIILVPFGEFLPFRIFLNFFDKIVGNNDFSSGKKTRLIKTSNNLKMIPIICYEIIFFNNLLNKYNNNSDILINITNDSWFGDFSGPYQHFYLSRMRATEFNKTLIRVSSNGISAVINNKGKVIDYIPLNKKGIKRFKIPIYLNSLPNLKNYHSLILILLFILFIFAIVFNKKNNN
ncbi:MAG: apolipoprotein N-acyltransferase [Pelagibacteraceae bacterium]|nr:apolipoprotein N-acyltransferase [Pelagibacteraceae bacterium]MBO6466016.1 apolipoprotein N-acyltransferase [Pelagibacteraceae bacterium]MBO6468177.1 apolipoprotein N-acyltransferase [Pelagibacteraceae bacterium]MBO6470701.1 apolipoprotein N-acyltransferase [Pelagibacteraceae bacterium]MBO6479017.1 apolipoprotein N-acyltransferase [Pelagibacteraceae bacterium]